MTVDQASRTHTATATSATPPAVVLPLSATQRLAEPARARSRRRHPAGGERPHASATDERVEDHAAEHAAACRFVAWLVRAVHEVTAGVRPYPQVAPLLAPTLARRLTLQLRRREHRPAAELTVRRVLLDPPTPTGALEGTAIVEHGGRVRALAVRLEQHRDVWRATELTAPEAGLPALSTASAPRRHEPDAFDVAAAEEDARTGRARVVDLSSRRGSA